MPTLVISLLFHASAAFLQYGQGMTSNGAAYYFACAVNALLASIGLWCLLFATDGGHISRWVYSSHFMNDIVLDRCGQGNVIEFTSSEHSNFNSERVAFPLRIRKPRKGNDYI